MFELIVKAAKQVTVCDKAYKACANYHDQLYAKYLIKQSFGLATPDDVRRIRFWGRAAIRYYRLSRGFNPWRPMRKNASTQDQPVL